jgi:hypothetical protein
MLERGMSLNHANFWITEKRDASKFMELRALEQSDADGGDAAEESNESEV